MRVPFLALLAAVSCAATAHTPAQTTAPPPRPFTALRSSPAFDQALQTS